MRQRDDNVIIAQSVTGARAGVCIIDSRVIEEPYTGHISLIYLEPEFRLKGLGAQLIDKAEQMCRQRGCRRMRLYVSVTNRIARSFYKKHGYARYGAQLSPFSGQIVLRKEL